MNILSARSQWLLQSTLGLLLTGAGLCLAIDAGFVRYEGKPWILYGTFALIVFNSGLCIVIDAGLRRLRYQSQSKL